GRGGAWGRPPAGGAAPPGGVRAEPPAPAARLGPSHVLALAVWFGVLAGLCELPVIALKVYGLGRVLRVSADTLWMAPLADALLFAVPGLLLAAATRLWPRLGSRRVGTL